MKKIAWVTADYFADCDIPYVPELLKDFDIHWIVILPIQPRFSEDCFVALKKQYNNLTVELIVSKTRERSPYKVFEYYKVIQIIRRVKPDIIYLNLIANSPWQIPMFLMLPKNKTIVTAHQGRVHEGMGHYRYNNFMRDIVYRRVKTVNMFSKSQAAYFKQRYQDSTVYEIPLGLKFYGNPTNVRPQDGPIRFLSFGIINYTKNIDLLINAACVLYERGVRGFVVSINGACSNWEWYQKQIKYPEIFVTDIRLIDNEEIPNLFNGSHYLVQPYRVVSQSGPTKVAFQYNLPVLTSNLQGFTDEVKEGINGYTFEKGNVEDLADKMQMLIENHSRYNELLQSEKEYTIKHYSKESLVEQYVSMFNEMLRKNG